MTNLLSELSTLSPSTVRRVDWQTLEDAVAVVRSTSRGSAKTSDPLTQDERDAARRAFQVAQTEFGKALSATRLVVRYTAAGIAISVAVAVCAGVLVQVTPWSGMVSLSAIGSLFLLYPRSLALARDQVMLELVPSRYMLAFELCATRKDVNELLTRFLNETASIRKSVSDR